MSLPLNSQNENAKCGNIFIFYFQNAKQRKSNRQFTLQQLNFNFFYFINQLQQNRRVLTGRNISITNKHTFISFPFFPCSFMAMFFSSFFEHLVLLYVLHIWDQFPRNYLANEKCLFWQLFENLDFSDFMPISYRKFGDFMIFQ